MRGSWKDGVWNYHRLGVIHNSIKVLFYYEDNSKKMKRVKQLSWETLYW